MAKRPLMDVSELVGNAPAPREAVGQGAPAALVHEAGYQLQDEPVVTLYIRAPQSVGLRLKELIHRRTMRARKRAYQNDVLLEAVVALLEKEGV